MVKIRCNITGEVYDAVESYTAEYIDKEIVVNTYGDFSEEEYIERHNKSAQNPCISTGLPKYWEDETQARKDDLIKFRYGRKLIETHKEYHKCVVNQSFNGYYVYSDVGGNANRGWAKLFNPNSVELL